MSIFDEPFPHNTSELARRFDKAIALPVITPELIADPFQAGWLSGRRDLVDQLLNALERETREE